MLSKAIGGILLIVGTSIGGGMLALPIANAETGFFASCFFLCACWAVMTIGAFFILEASLYLPKGAHLLSISQATLGNAGLIITWFSYLFLLYTLLAAYISGGGDVFGHWFQKFGIVLYPTVANILFTLLFGMIVYGGIRQVDWFNRLLMFGKLSIYVLLVVLLAPDVNFSYLKHGDATKMPGTIMILITSFGFSVIVPNLRQYFEDDLRLLRLVIFIGSLIPLICYIAWDFMIMGSLSQGALTSLLQSPEPTSMLAKLLSFRVESGFILTLFHFFTSICMLTAFLGVALCLMSFFADGFRMVSSGTSGLWLSILTFAPPLLMATVWPGAYLYALKYAGFFCVVLLILLPACMVIYGRRQFFSAFVTPGGQFTPWFLITIAILLLGNVFWQWGVMIL